MKGPKPGIAKRRNKWMNSQGPSAAKIQDRKHGKEIRERVTTRPPTRRSAVLDSADLKVVGNNTNQNRERKGPGVPRMSPGSPSRKHCYFLI
jgi:hypothetical protein